MRWTVCAEARRSRGIAAMGAMALLWAFASRAYGQALEWAGYVSAEPRVFFDAPAFREQDSDTVAFSAVAAPELRYEWRDGGDRITVAPFLRWDTNDARRSHADLREANWLHVEDPWSVRIGLGKVFWGVTESRHLVDIVNQTDLVEDIDEEDKLGQPMAHVERYTPLGTFGLFVLPGFRERTFPADDGRLRGPLPIARRAVYESGSGDDHTDLALRWDYSFGDWDLGAAAFRGTARDPRLVPTAQDGRTALVPHYDVVTQAGIDLQYTRGAWLWKLEAIRRSGQGSTFGAVVAGFEYTLYELGGSGMDLGLLAEYLYDGRDAGALPAVLDDDVFVGARLAFNDTDGTAFLFGLIADRDTHGTISFVEGQRRLGERWRLEAELRWLGSIEEATSAWRQDSFLTLRLARFF